jgi:hypothetical protein
VAKQAKTGVSINGTSGIEPSPGSTTFFQAKSKHLRCQVMQLIVISLIRFAFRAGQPARCKKGRQLGQSPGRLDGHAAQQGEGSREPAACCAI